MWVFFYSLRIITKPHSSTEVCTYAQLGRTPCIL